MFTLKGSGKRTKVLNLLISFTLLGGLVFGLTSTEEFKREQQAYIRVKEYRGLTKDMGIITELFKKRKSVLTVAKSLPELSEKTVKEHVDFDFIRELEGFSLKGYVPKSNGRPLGKSGVTIATGFDIGQRDVKDLEKLGLNPSLIKKLAPYTNKTKWEAVNYLHKNPLTITKAEADEIDSILRVSKVRGIINTVGEEVWNKMDYGLRTVLASVQFQYGDAKTRTPNFFKKVLSLDIDSVVSHLQNFGDKYPTRRKKEAQYLIKVSSKNSNTKDV